MEITDVRVFPRRDGNLLAGVTLILDGVVVIRHCKLLESSHLGRFVALPALKRCDGSFSDAVDIVDQGFRDELLDAVSREYDRVMAEAAAEAAAEKPDWAWRDWRTRV